MSSRSYITNYAIWHQSLKSIHYKILLIFQTKKRTDLRVKTWGGGDKRHVIPPMSKHGGDTYPPSPPGFTPLPSSTYACMTTDMFCSDLG